MMSFLTRIYPFKQSRHWLRDGFFYGLVIWAILYFLQPFGFCLYQGNKCLAAALFGMVTFVCYALYLALVLKRFHRTVNPWRIWHEGMAVLGLIVMIAISLSLYNHSQAFSVVFELDDYCRCVSDFAVSRNTIQQIFKRQDGRIVAQNDSGTKGGDYYNPRYEQQGK